MINAPPLVKQILFPCDYMLKVIGLATEEFESTVIPILNKHIPTLTETAITYNTSNSNKYLAMTVNFHAHNKEQVDALYKELTASSAVLMAL